MFDIDLTRRSLKESAPDIILDCVTSQSEALSLLENNPDYDLVLSDMRLADGDGLAVLSNIRGRNLPLAVVLITAHGDEETAVTALKAGAQDYIVKRKDYLTNLPLVLENALLCFRQEEIRCTQPLRVLYAEPHAPDVDLARRHMADFAPYIHLEAVSCASEVFQRLEDQADDAYQVILLDYRLPGMNALEILKELFQVRKFDLPVILITGQGDEGVAVQALKLGAADYVVKSKGYLHKLPSALENAVFSNKLAREHASLLESDAKLQHSLDTLRKAVDGSISLLALTVETRDPYTSGHQRRVANLAKTIASEMGLSEDQIEGIHMAGLIHDVGKIGIPAEILSKPGRISKIELSLLQTHAQAGYDLLKDVEFPWPIGRIVLQHHERMDGSGYPRNLKGDEICIEARILTVADVVEAMESHRPYRPGLGIDAALEEIEKNSGIYYDAAVAGACLRLFREKGFKLEGA